MRCRVCHRQMRLLCVVPDVLSMAPGYEYRLCECLGGHGQRWARVFNGPRMVKPARVPHAPSRLRVWIANTAGVAGDIWARAATVLTAKRRRLAAIALSQSRRVGKIAGDCFSAWAKRANALAHASRHAALGAMVRSPHMPANRKPAAIRRPIQLAVRRPSAPGAVRRPTAAQVEEATFLLRRLARVHRRALPTALRPQGRVSRRGHEISW
jgi:hypothetical protein